MVDKAPSGLTDAGALDGTEIIILTKGGNSRKSTTQAVANLGGGGAGTFLELTDTPAAYGTAGQYVALNGTGDGLIFVDPPSGSGISDAPIDTNLYGRRDGAWTIVDWSLVQGKPATFPPDAHTHPWAEVTGRPATIDAIPAALGAVGTAMRVAADGATMEWFTPGTGGGAATFLELSDTPAAYGTAGQMVVVNGTGDALVFSDPPSSGIADAPSDGTPYARQDAAWVQGIRGDGSITRIIALTQAQYNAIATPDPTTQYIITDADGPTFLELTDTPAAFGTAGQLAAVNGTGDGLIFTDPPSGGGGGAGEVFHARDDATGVWSGSSAAGWNTRILTTAKTNQITGASLVTNQITLPAGTYSVWGRVPGYKVGDHQCRLRNVTDGADTLVGSNALAPSGSSDQSDTVLVGDFTINAQKTFELQQYCELAATANGLGKSNGSGLAQVYAEIRIVKVA